MSKIISDATKARMFRYYKHLCELAKSGQVRTSSAAIAQALNLTASQVRQDFNALGCFGHQGYGYQIHQLIEELSEVARLKSHRSTVLVGLNALGRAVASSLNFDNLGFHLMALFDSRESITGQIVRDMPVRHISDLDEFCRENKIKAAILCLPQSTAWAVAHQLAKSGVTGIWNLSNCELPDMPDVVIQNLDLEQNLMQLSFLME